MHRADLAELLLSLATTRERAVSVVGDLLESSESQGAGQFWFLVARTIVRQACLEMAAEPLGMAGTAVRGWFAGCGISVASAVLVGMPALIVLAVLKFGFQVDRFDLAISLLGKFLAWLLIPFQLGRWMARRYPGREVAGCFSLVTLQFTLGMCVAFIVWVMAYASILRRWGFSPSGISEISRQSTIFHTLAYAVAGAVLRLAPLLAGAAFARARMLKSTPV